MLNDPPIINKVIEVALTLLALMFIITVIASVLVTATAVFLDLVARFSAGIRYVKKLLKSRFGKQ